MKYEEYKDSGVEWIGQVPSHWEVMRFKDFTSLQTTASDNMNKIGLENIEGKTGRFIESDSEFEGNGIAFNIGDVVYGKLRPYLQKVWIATFSGNAVGDFFVFRPKDNCYNQYLFYCMLSDGFTSMCNGSTVGAKMPRVSSDFIRSLHYYLPPLSEQEAIATYLDEKCEKINTAIEVQKKKIELLEELKQTVITEAVTKGLNPDAPMKDSGVEWIGQVPSHWEVCRLKNYCSLKARIGWKGLRSDEFEEESFAYLVTGQDFGGSKIDWSKCYQINRIRYNEDPYIQLRNGDILITKDGTIGKIAIVDNLDKPACLNSGVFVLKQKDNKFSPSFLYWVLYSTLLKDFNTYTSTGTTILHLYQNVFEEMPLVISPLTEQEAIATYLDEKCGKINTAIEQQKKKIELLEELKQSIITEAVTGKVKVC